MSEIFPTIIRMAEVIVEERTRAAQPPREPDSVADWPKDDQDGYWLGEGVSGGPEARAAFRASLIVLSLLTPVPVAFIFV